MRASTSKTTVQLTPIRDMAGEPWEAALRLGGADGRQPPIVLLRGPLAPHLVLDYCLSGFLRSAALGERFRIADPLSDDLVHQFSPVAVAHLAAEAVSLIPGSVGRFEVVWEPQDSKVPF